MLSFSMLEVSNRFSSAQLCGRQKVPVEDLDYRTLSTFHHFRLFAPLSFHFYNRHVSSSIQIWTKNYLVSF